MGNVFWGRNRTWPWHAGAAISARSFRRTEKRRRHHFVIRNSSPATHVAAILIALVILSIAAGADTRADLLQINTAFHEALREANASALALVLDNRFTWTN